jgi:hypothetical protein
MVTKTRNNMAIKKVTIEKLFKNTTDKDGIAYTYKKGKYTGQNFTRVSIKTSLSDDMYSSCVLNGDRALNLEIGQEVLLKLTESNGYKNFAFPTKDEEELYNDLANSI